MPCYSALPAFKTTAGRILTKKSQLEQNEKAIYGNPVQHYVPCGTCIGCNERRAMDWAIRCAHEEMLHSQSCFLTLTLAPEFMPENGSLVRDLYDDHGQLLADGHWSGFRKRLRENFGPFRFFHVGEYGDESQRAHYHAMIFGHDFTESRQILKRKPHIMWTQDRLRDTWGMGHVSVEDLTFGTALYISQYTTKKRKKAFEVDRYARVNPDTGETWNVIPEYQSSSLRPAIGKQFFDEHWKEIYSHDEVKLNGRTYRPPRYYDRLLSETHPGVWQIVKQERAAYAKSKEPMSEARLAQKEIHALRKARTTHSQRSL